MSDARFDIEFELSTVPGLSQYSAEDGVTFRICIDGSSALSHQALAGVAQRSRIFSRSFWTSAVPEIETYFWPLLSANARQTFGWRDTSSSLWLAKSVRK